MEYISEFYKKIKSVLQYPHKFFKTIKKEKGIRQAFIFYLIFLGITIVISIGLIPQSLQPLAEKLGRSMNAGWYVGLVIVSIAASISFLFIGTGIVHLFVRLLKGKNKYPETFRALVYGNTPRFILDPVAVVLTGYLPLALPSAAAALGIIVTVVTIIVIIYTIYLRVIGLGILQKLTLWRSFAALILLPLALLLVIAVILAAIIAVIAVLYAKKFGI